MAKPRARTLLLGLDGATWRTLLPMTKAGVMPSLAGLMEKGSWGVLRSTHPPITGAAWLALASGMNPGKTGVIDFFTRESPGELRLRRVGSHDYRGRAYWDLMDAMGLGVGVAFYPTLYPPYPVNGFMVSGLGSPGDRPYAYPPELQEKIEEIAPGYVTLIRYTGERYSDLATFRDDMVKHVEQTARIMKHLLDRYGELDHLTLVVSNLDWVQHRAWHVLEEHPRLRGSRERGQKRLVEDIYRAVDDLVGMIAEAAFSQERVIIGVSDHGFQPQLGVLGLARLLRKRGIMRVRRGLYYRALLLSYAKRVAKALGAKRLLGRRAGAAVAKAAAPRLNRVIDYEASRAYVLDHSILFGAVYVNPRFPREEVIREVLEVLREAEKRYGLKIAAMRREEIYSGPESDKLPDLLISVNDYATAVGHRLEYPEYSPGPLHPRYTGTHHMDGILLVAGPGVKRLEKVSASIYDIAPTLLYLHGLPVPDDMDGKPLRQVVDLGEPRYTSRSHYEARLRAKEAAIRAALRRGEKK